MLNNVMMEMILIQTIVSIARMHTVEMESKEILNNVMMEIMLTLMTAQINARLRDVEMDSYKQALRNAMMAMTSTVTIVLKIVSLLSAEMVIFGTVEQEKKSVMIITQSILTAAQIYVK